MLNSLNLWSISISFITNTRMAKAIPNVIAPTIIIVLAARVIPTSK